MATGILKVDGDKVVGNDGKPIILRGSALGGWYVSSLSIVID